MLGSADSWVGVTGTATNIGDGQLGSSVAFVVDCRPIDLAFESASEEDEEGPGGFLCAEGAPSHPALMLIASPGLEGTVALELVEDAGRIELYHDPAGTDPAGGFGQPVPAPTTYYVKGIGISTSAGDVELLLRYSDGEPSCDDRVKLTVASLDLDFEDLDDNDETNPGGLVCLNAEPPLPALTLTSRPDLNRTVMLNPLQGAGRIQLYSDVSGTVPADVLGQPVQPPKTYYVKGIGASSTSRDVELSLTYSDGYPECEDKVNLTVPGVDLGFDDLNGEDEEDPGGFLFITDDDRPPTPLTLTADGELDGTIEFDVESGSGLIQIYEDAAGQNPVSSFHQSWPASALPVTRYVKGVVRSTVPRNVEFRLGYTGGGGSCCEDRVRLTAVEFDLHFAGLTGAEETDPGGFLCVGGDPPLPALSLTSQPNVGQTVTLELLQGAGRIQLYDDPDGASPADVFGQPLQPPKTYYVQGADGSAALGDVELRLRYDNGDPLCEDRVNLTMFKVDLDGDADHDAALADEGPDDELEETLPGVIVLCNQDDDNQDTVVDNTDDILNGADDYDDLTPIAIRQMPIVEPTWTVTLILENPTNVATGIDASEVVRVFPDTAANTVALLGPGTTSYTLMDSAPAHDVDLAALGTGDVTLWVEGLEFAGEVQLRLHVEDDAGRLTCEDSIQLKVAPLILLGHLQSADTSYVSRICGSPEIEAESAAYCTQRFPNATPPGVQDTIIGTSLNNGDDPWAQDEFQIGFQEAPHKSMYVVLDSKRDGGSSPVGLTPFPMSLLAPDFGHIQIDNGNPANSFDYFGNLEVSPPVNPSYPNGRVYYGDDDALLDRDRIDKALRDFLERQGVQAPWAFLSSWLLVGHVDEFMSLVPNPNSTHGWTVLLADPELAMDILQGNALVAGGVTEALHIPRYSDYQVVQLGALLGRSTSDGSTTIEQYNAPGGPVDAVLEILETAVSEAFGLDFSQDIYPVPVLFDAVTGKALAITPDMVNGSVYGNTFIAPDPFLHASIEEDVNANFKLDPGEDTNGNFMLDTLRDPFQVWLNQNAPASITLTYIDDWLIYHLNNGEVHCGSNERRTIPSDARWWESGP